MARAFVIRPFGKKKDNAGNELDFDSVHNDLITPALESAGLPGDTTGQIVEAGNIREDMFKLILEADVVISDISIDNANVFYELGIRHALRKKSTILIKGGEAEDKDPFDLLTDRYLVYEFSDPAAKVDELVEMIRASQISDRETDSPIFQMLPSLSEGDPSEVTPLPLEFSNEVARARAAQHGGQGWLRLLYGEVHGLRWEWEGLKLVGLTQWRLKDWTGAKRSYEAIRDNSPDDIDANLALANVYERLYRKGKNPQFLVLSNQAIEKALESDHLPRADRAEALALEGRNHKTQWRLAFEDRATAEERRARATSRIAIRAYKSYRDAYFNDLNKYYPGLTALQMTTILNELSKEESWPNAFDSDKDAESFRNELQEQINELRIMAPAAVDVALQGLEKDSEDARWVRISKADVLFLMQNGRDQRVVEAYLDAVPADDPFAWDAAKGQLKLFASVGVKAELAEKIIQAVEERNKNFDVSRDAEEDEDAKPKPLHLLVFAGHLVDKGDRAPRFPQAAADHAKSMIREAVKSVMEDSEYRYEGLACAAPGTDIIAHEVCDELGIRSTICLPMPARDYAREIFKGLDAWRDRFLDLKDKHQLLELSHRPGLPRWLQGSTADPWERGNRWVKEVSVTWGAKRVTLIALWDGEGRGTLGGTAQMVELAEQEGEIRIKQLDAKELVNYA